MQMTATAPASVQDRAREQEFNHFPQIPELKPACSLRPPPRDHVIAYRVSLPFFGQRYYLAFFCGHEARSLDRLAAEEQRKSWWHTTFSASAVFLFGSSLLMSGAATAYLAKSLIGVDIFDDHFILHGMFFN